MFDLTVLERNIKIMEDFNQVYKNYCDNITQKAKTPDRFVKIFKQVFFTDVTKICMQNGLVPWTIENIDDEIKAKTIMMAESVTETTAQVYLAPDNATLLSLREDKNQTYLQIRSCHGCTPSNKFNYTAHKLQYPDSRLEWSYDLTSMGIILAAQTKHFSANLNVFCAKGDMELQQNVLRMISASCARDIVDIARVNEMLKLELDQLTMPNRRSKRSLALIGAGLLGTDLAVSAITGQSPLSQIGQGIAHTFGVATMQDIRLTREELNKHAQALQNLSLNQYELLNAQIALTKDILTVKSLVNDVGHNLAIAYGEIDLKANLYRLQDMVQQTMVKIVMAIQAAKVLQTSPYVFGKRDLANITAQFRYDNIPLTTSVDDVITTVMIIEKTYTFIVMVPIIKTTNDFQFNEVKVLPVFNNGEGFQTGNNTNICGYKCSI